jgi:PPE-repeat proteins
MTDHRITFKLEDEERTVVLSTDNEWITLGELFMLWVDFASGCGYVVNKDRRNDGWYNTGSLNTGYHNAGDRNPAYCNTGYHNTGQYNTGDRNTGHYNTGYRNTGNWNSASDHVGCFNTIDAETAYFFNKPLKIDVWNEAHIPDWLGVPKPTAWVSSKT